ncbi:MAG: endonuclease [Bacteroidaceae bacterium]|nr:endonuclease [Bacteroidaceae bacterium]
MNDFGGLKRRWSFLIWVLLVACCCLAQDNYRFRVVSYNVENLFDYQHDDLKNDYEFLPDAARHWDYQKYRKKLDDLGRVIIATGEWTPPALVGLCEVENEHCLTDLTEHSVLKEAGYRYIMTNSPDQRGIDVALLYQHEVFKPLTVKTYRVPPFTKQKNATRDILHVTGELPNHSLLDVLVCHLPSRSGGEKESEPYRLLAAGVLRQAVDSIMEVRNKAQVVIMGDFNDYYNNRSVAEVLGAKPVTTLKTDKQQLYHLLAAKEAAMKDYGSYRYRGEWDSLDHIIVNGRLLRQKGAFHIQPSDDAFWVKADVFIADFLLEDDDRYGGKMPFRTYSGMKYKGGYSDHLPIYADFILKY